MEKKRELLAKALMDTSKVLLITLYAKSFLDPSFIDSQIVVKHLLAIIIVGCLAWILQPEKSKTRKRRLNNG